MPSASHILLQKFMHYHIHKILKIEIKWQIELLERTVQLLNLTAKDLLNVPSARPFAPLSSLQATKRDWEVTRASLRALISISASSMIDVQFLDH